MDWFERLTGFREESYEATRAKLRVEGGHLHSLVNGKSYGVGEFELASLRTLRERAATLTGMSGRLKVSVVTGDVRQMPRHGYKTPGSERSKPCYELIDPTLPATLPLAA